MNEDGIIVAFFTGQSDPRTNALSPAQRSFLQRSPVLPDQWLKTNFPYRPAMEWSEPHLVRASFNNALQYLGSRFTKFEKTYRPPFMEAFPGEGKILLLAGSCGLELLTNLRLPETVLQRLHVFAYGPVSRSLPSCASLITVQGRRDVISRWWHRRVDHVVSCGHMNYLETEETLRLFSAFYRQVEGERKR